MWPDDAAEGQRHGFGRGRNLRIVGVALTCAVSVGLSVALVRPIAGRRDDESAKMTGRTRFGAAPVEGQHYLDEPLAFVLRLFSTPSRRTLLVRSFRTRRKLGRHCLKRDGPGKENIDHNFFLAPRNSLISPDSGK